MFGSFSDLSVAWTACCLHNCSCNYIFPTVLDFSGKQRKSTASILQLPFVVALLSNQCPIIPIPGSHQLGVVFAMATLWSDVIATVVSPVESACILKRRVRYITTGRWWRNDDLSHKHKCSPMSVPILEQRKGMILCHSRHATWPSSPCQPLDV